MAKIYQWLSGLWWWSICQRICFELQRSEFDPG